MAEANNPIDWKGQQRVSLALRGGGSHRSFTWGVLDYLLENGRLEIEAITGTSAGAMNAVVLAEGFLEGGREGARKCLAKFWRSISDAGAFSSAERKFLDIFFQHAVAVDGHAIVDRFFHSLFELL
jgi:NTE family protein